VTGYSSTPASVSLSANSHREHPTFNQLLGINNRGQIAGYFGSGAAGHPNKGYVLNLGPSSSFTNENFPGGIQTQVIGINDTGVSVGFWSTQNTKSQTNNNFGFHDWHGQFHSVKFPTRNNAKPPVNQLLGVNNAGIAVGFYNGAQGNSHAYAYSIPGGWFHRIRIHGAVSSTASGINNRGDIAGFYTGRDGVTTYMVGTGNNAKSSGFIWARDFGFRTINAPHGPAHLGHAGPRADRCGPNPLLTLLAGSCTNPRKSRRAGPESPAPGPARRAVSARDGRPEGPPVRHRGSRGVLRSGPAPWDGCDESAKYGSPTGSPPPEGPHDGRRL
jgi:hypothetical protein